MLFRSVNIDTGEKILIGDTQYYPTAAVQPFRTGQGRAYVRSLSPANGYVGTAPLPTIKAELVDGRTTVVDGSVQLWIDGAQVAAQVQNGATTTVTYTPARAFVYGTQHSGALVWNESTTPVTSHTNAFTFTIEPFSPTTLPPNSFWIEAEDYDYGGGQTVPAASTMPYRGGAYSNLVGHINVDYFDTETGQFNAETGAFTDGVTAYRGSSRTGPNAVLSNISYETGGQYTMSRPGGITMTANFKIGWVGGDNWWNYTRNIPAGTYRVYAAQSLGDTGEMNSQLHLVTAGVGQTNVNNAQVLQTLGTFRGSGSTGWSQNQLIPLKDGAGNNTAVKLPGGQVTLRWQGGNGDIDWMVLAPASDVPPKVLSSGATSASLTIQSYTDLSVPRDVVLRWQVEDFSTQVDPASIKLMFDGVDVSTGLVVSKAGDVTTITYDPPGLLELGQSYPYEFSFADTSTPPQTQRDSNTLVANYIPDTPAGSFLIEAEDFNTAGGDFLAEVDTMPYLGGAYTNLAAVEGIDYQRSSVVADGDVYRIGETNNVPMGANFDANTYDRIRSINSSGTWEVTANYSCGWSGVGNWLNYTRTIPANTYQVWAGMSSDRAAVADGLVASLSRVVGSASVSNQVVEAIGTFQSAGTRGWGNTALVPLRNASQEVVEVAFSGVTTLRVDMNYGDVDYLMLIPTGGALPPQFTSVVINENGSITVTWEGDGVLEAAPDVTGPWGVIEGATSPFTFEPTDSRLFGRIKN